MSDLFPGVATIGAVVAALRTLRVQNLGSEYELHRCIGDALTRHGLVWHKEVKLAPRCRIDFTVGALGGEAIGIEAKAKKPNANNLRDQAARYIEASERRGSPVALTGLVLVVERSVSRLPNEFIVAPGRPVHVLSLSKQWGISL